MEIRRLWVVALVLFFSVLGIIYIFQPETDYNKITINQEQPLEFDLKGIDVEVTSWERDFVQITKSNSSFGGASSYSISNQIKVSRLVQEGNKITLTENTVPFRFFYQVDNWLSLAIFDRYKKRISFWFRPQSDVKSLVVKVPLNTTVILNGEIVQPEKD